MGLVLLWHVFSFLFFFVQQFSIRLAYRYMLTDKEIKGKDQDGIDFVLMLMEIE